MSEIPTATLEPHDPMAPPHEPPTHHEPEPPHDPHGPHDPHEPERDPFFDWTVGFYGPFRVRTRLKHEKEIDVDDRAAVLEVIVEMMPPGHLDLVARNVRIRLDFDFSELLDEHGDAEGDDDGSLEAA